MSSFNINQATISKAQAGDARALNFIVKSYIPLVRWFVFKTCRAYHLLEWKDDMFSYVLPKLLLAISSYDSSRSSLNNWVTYYIRSAVRTFKDTHKYEHLNDDISSYADVLVDEIDMADAQQAEFEDEVNALFMHNDVSLRKVNILKLRYLSDATYDDIAAVYHLTREGARQATKRAERCLQNISKQLDIGYVP